MQVEVRNNNIDRALKVMKRKLRDDRMFQQLEQKMYYEKPSEKRNRERRQAISRARKDNAARMETLNG